MVAVADVFDALTTRRPYKEPMPLAVARDYLVENKGRQFDPTCVEAFLSRWTDVEAMRATGQNAAPFQKGGLRTPVVEAPQLVPSESDLPETCPAE